MIFQKFRTRFLLFWRNLTFCVVQAGSAVGSELRGFAHSLRRLIPSKQPLPWGNSVRNGDAGKT